MHSLVGKGAMQVTQMIVNRYQITARIILAAGGGGRTIEAGVRTVGVEVVVGGVKVGGDDTAAAMIQALGIGVIVS